MPESSNRIDSAASARSHMTEPLTNGHDKHDAEACDSGAVALQYQLRAVQIGAARHAEKATIEALIRDAQARYVRARQANNYTAQAEKKAARPIRGARSVLALI